MFKDLVLGLLIRVVGMMRSRVVNNKQGMEVVKVVRLFFNDVRMRLQRV
jgi:hypothetical protein